jgi:hypothetical protein
MAAPYYGWYVVAACATLACFSWGFAFYRLGVYLHVLVRLHGWPTGLISVAVTAYYLIGLIRDTRGSYQPALWVLVVLEVLAIAGVLWGRALRGPRAPLPAG